MKKRMLVLTCLLAAALLLTACGAQDQKNETAKEKLHLGEKVRSAAADTEELAELTGEDLSDVLGADPADCPEFVFLQSDGMDGREILVMRAKDADAAKRLADLAQAYLDRRLEETRNYAPEAYQLLSAAKVRTRNLTVALVAGENAAAETEAILAGE